MLSYSYKALPFFQINLRLMDLTYKDKIIKYLGHNLNIETINYEPNFHLDCKFSKKKVCSCVFRQEYTMQKELSQIISVISSDDTFFDVKNNKIIYKNANEIKNYSLKVLEERILNTPLQSLKEIIQEFEGDNFSSLELKEVYRLIEKDKKKCEFCNILIQDNNSFKGWKNDSGEYVLLCATCNKKYLDGTLDKEDDEESTDFRKNNSNTNFSALTSKNAAMINNANSILNGNSGKIFISNIENTPKLQNNTFNISANSNGIHNKNNNTNTKNEKNEISDEDEEYLEPNNNNKNRVFKVTEVKHMNRESSENRDNRSDKLIGNKRSELFTIKKEENVQSH